MSLQTAPYRALRLIVAALVILALTGSPAPTDIYAFEDVRDVE